MKQLRLIRPIAGVGATLLALGLLATACTSDAPAPSAPPAPASASGGRGGAGSGTGGGGGAVGGGGVGGGGGVSGGGGGGGQASSEAGTQAPVDAPVAAADVAADAPSADAPAPDAGDASFRPIIPDAQPWQMMCPPGASLADCCGLYCQCMAKHCPATIPADCPQACLAGKNWDLTCRTYQCFATQNPSFPQDMASHCQHAVGKQGRCGNR